MKNKILILILLFVIIMPQIAFASWWNPFSWSMWNIFRSTTYERQVQIATTTSTIFSTTTEKISTNIDKEKPKNGDNPLTSLSKKPVTETPQNDQPKIIEKPKAQIQSVTTPSPVCTTDVWNCSDWLDCSSSGSQTRSCSKTFECPSMVTPSPTTSRSCTPSEPSCHADTWSCGDWNLCSDSGSQTRTCNKTFDCPSVVTQSPITSQSCVPPMPSCQADIWACNDWNSCSDSGNQTRNCTKTFECPSADTPSPNIKQNCTIPQQTYEQLHCPKILNVKDSLGNTGIDGKGFRGTFQKGSISSITVTAQTSDPQNLPLYYRFVGMNLSDIKSSDKSYNPFEWSTNNQATFDVTKANAGIDSAGIYVQVKNEDGFGCLGSNEWDTMTSVGYDVLP